MRRWISVAVVLLVWASLPLAAEPSSRGSKARPKAVIAGASVTFGAADAPGGPASGYLALPPGTAQKQRPALIVVHEWWGLNDWARQQADRFARDGYVALAVDLYRGRVTDDPAVAHELARGLPEDRANADLEAAFRYLAARPDVDPARIGSIGWCMGGGYALGLAVAEPKLAACVINYGRLVTAPAAISGIQAPLLGNFGGKDQGITPADVEAFVAAMKKQSKAVDFKIYPAAGHGFMNPDNTKGFVKGAADDAWRRIDPFFASRLKNGGRK